MRFRTQATITVPRAELVGLTIFPARASVKVTAVDGGPDGNVDAGTITIVPSGENSFFLKVTNPQPTAGGTSTEFSRVTQADVDGALAALNLSLQQAFQEAMADPVARDRRFDRLPLDRAARRGDTQRRPRHPGRPGGHDVRARPIRGRDGHRRRRGAGQLARRAEDPGRRLARS